MKRVLSLILALSLILSLLPSFAFAAEAEEASSVEFVYDISTRSYNIGNDNDGDGVVDDFGDSAESLHAGNLTSTSMYNTWTDKTADKFIPFYSSGVVKTESGSTTDGNYIYPAAGASYNGYVWMRGREALWRLYPIWTTYTNNEKYFTTYDYQNLNNTYPWLWTGLNSGVTSNNTYLTSGQTYIVASGKTITEGEEPYVTLKLKVPAAGLYDVTVGAQNLGMEKLYFYMLPAESENLSREELLADDNLVGRLDQRKYQSATFKKAFSAPAAGEYYFAIKMANNNWAEGETLPTQWIAYLKTIKLTLVPDDEARFSYKISTRSYNIGNDTDGDGHPDDFGDSAESLHAENLTSTSMYNTWTDKTADKFIPFYSSGVATKADGTVYDTNYIYPTEGASDNGYAHMRGREKLWRLYPIWKTYTNNKKYFTTYAYQNLNNTDPWQWTEFNAGLQVDNTYLTSGGSYVVAKGKTITDGAEPYVTLRLKVPVAGLYDVTFNSTTLGTERLYFYMLRDTEASYTRAELTASSNFIGALDQRKHKSGTFKKSFEAPVAGEYLFVIKMDNDNWAEGATLPTQWIAYLSSIDLTLNQKGTYVHFSKLPTSDISDYSTQNGGWALNYGKSHASIADSKITGYGIELTSSELSANAAIDVYAPYDGVYELDLVSVHRENGTASADVYADGAYMGNVAFNGRADKMEETKTLRSVYLTAGVHTINLVPKEAYGDVSTQHMTVKDIALKMVAILPAIKEVSSETMYIRAGETAYPEVFVRTADGFTYPASAYAENAYSDKHLAFDFDIKSGDDCISLDGNGNVTATKAGKAKLTANVTYKDGAGDVISTKSTDVAVVISDASENPLLSAFSELEITEEGSFAPHLVLPPQGSVTYTAKAINGIGGALDLSEADISWALSGDGKGSFTLSGASGERVTVTAKATATAKLTLTVTLDGETKTVQAQLVCRDGKVGRTLYTDEMVAAARENIEKFSWAKSEKDSAVAKADKYLAVDLDYMWDHVTSQDLPRAYRVGFRRDPEEYICRFCGVDLSVKYGNYCYSVDVFNNPWKIKCPECDKNFPTNDFESFYHLGRTVENNGKFNRITALENHRAMLIDKGLLSAEARALTEPGEDGSETWKKYYGYGVEGGYLYNETCPEVGTAASAATLSSWETVEGWGVDDGYGYVTGREYVNKVPEIYTYAAYYNHFATWFGTTYVLIVGGIDALSTAYLYTGDEKYGKVGAILLDRVADVYPELDLSPYGAQGYPNNDGEARTGKAVGRIWECFPSEMLGAAYDKLFPMFENEEVVEYLDAKAREWGMGDAKSTPEKIKKNVEDGICVAIFNAAKAAKIQGNFGLHQASIATAAVALDRYPETQEMIDWLFHASETDSRTYNTGGDISRRLVQIVYRDGQNYESPYYNEMGISDFGDAAVALARYDGYDGMSIYEHPKYLQYINSFQLMTLLRYGVKAIGDSSYAVQYADYPSAESMKEAFRYIKDNPDLLPATVKIAQHLYLKAGNLTNMRYDIFTENPHSLAEDVGAIIEEYGEYNYDKSSILTGYGLAILRDGTLAPSANANGLRDTQRDFTLNFSGHYSHNHVDLLDLGMESYGMGMTTDLGYPETPISGDPHSAQWSQAAIGHNTVVVDEKNQKSPKVPQKPLHFDAKDSRVKVMDASAADAYDECDEYRRTLVMIDYDDDVSYGVDFFRVSGGNDHLYTFQPNSEEHPTVSGNISAKFATQNGGSYAGADVPFGNDPNTLTSDELAYPRGYTWMYDVDRADNPGENEFWLDYQIKDFRGHSRNGAIDVRLRATVLNDFEPDEVSLVSTKPQRIASNNCIEHLEKFLIRRKGEDLDSLFTTVYEPYREGARYVEDIASAILTVSGNDGDGDVVKAVRVKLGGDETRYDYIVYATNNNVTYTVTDTEREYSFTFRGFVGVHTVNEENENVYGYVHDGELIAGSEYDYAEITGTVSDWQKELSVFNWVDITFDEALPEETAYALSDRMMNVERDEPGNSSFMVEGVTPLTYEGENVKTARLDLGTITPISGYVDIMDESRGYTYDMFEDASFAIPMSYEATETLVKSITPNKKWMWLEPGKSETLVVDIAPEDAVDKTLEWTTSDDKVATVTDGVVTATGVGNAIITVTNESSGVFTEITVVVLPEDLGNVGKTFTYRMSAAYAKAEKDQHGRVNNISLLDSYDKFDFSDGTSSIWALDNSNLPYNAVYAGFFQFEPGVDQFKTQNPPFTALKIFVENKGDYSLTILPHLQSRGMDVDVYVVPAEDGVKATRSLIEGKEPIGTVPFLGITADSADVTLEGVVEIPERGSYFVIFDYIEPTHGVSSGGRYAAWIKSMTLNSINYPFDRIELSMDNVADNTMALKTESKISWRLLDALGKDLEDFNPENVVVNSITSSNGDVAEADIDGTVRALSCGTTDITVNLTYTDGEAITREATYPLTVAPAGGNLFRGILSDFEGTYVADEWGWSTANNANATGFVKGYITEDADNPGNNIFKMDFDPDVGADSTAGMVLSPGFRVPVKANKFYVLTFRFKSDMQLPAGANAFWSTTDQYVYVNNYSNKNSDFAYNAERSYNFTSSGWQDRYSTWQTVTVPVVAPTEVADGIDTVYIMPRIIFRWAGDAGKTGYSGSFYFDDFAIREVGYDSVELNVTGNTASAMAGDELGLEIRPKTTLGTYFSMGGAWSAESVTLTSGDETVVGNFSAPELSGAKISATADVMGASGTADITASVEINGITRSVTEPVDVTTIVPVTGVSLDKETLTMKVGDTETLVATVAPADATDKNVIWTTSEETVATVENGVVTAVGAGNAIITATTADGSFTATSEVTVEPQVELIDYKFGQTVQIGLIEPWALKANLRVYTADHPTKIDYSKLVDYGVYFVRGSALADTGSVSEADIINNPNTVKYSKEAGTATIDGSYLTANYDKGLYTYEMSDSIFVMFYIEDASGIRYAPIRERNLQSLLEVRKDDAATFENVLERNVYSAMHKLEEDIGIYRAQFKVIEEVAMQKAPKLSEYVARNGEFGQETKVNYKFGHTVQISLIEPWGLKFNARVYNNSNPNCINYANVEEYGAIVYYDTEGVVDSMTADELMTRSDAYVFSSKNGDATIDGSYITAIYNKGIYTYQLDSNAYVMFFVKDADGYHYGGVKVRNAFDLATARGSDTSGDFGEKEKNVYKDMIVLYNDVKSYRDDYFANH